MSYAHLDCPAISHAFSAWLVCHYGCGKLSLLILCTSSDGRRVYLRSPSIGREPTQSGNEHYSLACCPLRFLTQASLFDLAGPLIKPGHFFVRRPLGGV